MHVQSNFRDTTGVVTRIVNDELDGRHRRFAFIEDEIGTIFLPMNTVNEFANDFGSYVVIAGGDWLDVEYALHGEQRRVTRIISHDAGESHLGTVKVLPKGCGFANPNEQFASSRGAFINNRVVQELGLKGGEPVRFTCRENDRGLQALAVDRIDGRGGTPMLVCESKCTEMEFVSPVKQAGGPPAHMKAKKATQAARDRELRNQMRGKPGK